MRKLTAMAAVLTMVVAMAPVSLSASPALTGGVRGTIVENSGRSLAPGLQARLVNSLGNTVPGMTTAVASDGRYVFNNVAPGMYTVQILGAAGMSAVTVTAGTVSTANVTVANPPRRVTTAGKLVIVAAVVGGVAIVTYVATKNDASGSS